MKGFISKHKKLTVAIGLVTLLVVLWLSASIRGRLVAHFDVVRGHYKVLSYGLPVSWRPEYVRLLRERYGIEHRAVAGCVVSESLVSYVHGYNAVSTAAVNRKFGHDVFEECAEDARKNWERQMQERYGVGPG
jgi:hypothetical protein